MAQQQMSGHEFRQRISWALGLAVGIGVGMGLGTLTGNFALGLAVGVAVGIAITVTIVTLDNRALRREHAARVAEAEGTESADQDATPHALSGDATDSSGGASAG